MKISKEVRSLLNEIAGKLNGDQTPPTNYGDIASSLSKVMSALGFNIDSYKFKIMAESFQAASERTIVYQQYLETLAEQVDFLEYEEDIEVIGPQSLIPRLRLDEAEVDRLSVYIKEEALKVIVEYNLSSNIEPMTKEEIPSVYQRVSSASTEDLWKAVLDAEGVQEEERELILSKIRIEIARVIRPKWQGRLKRGGELATLSAPEFLKEVHADEIAEDGTVYNEVIRAIDPDLMRAVEVYISARLKRGADLGNAEGLNFVLSRPSRRAAALPPPQNG